MTIRELKNSAYTLAGLSGSNADPIFISSLSSALLTLYSDLKITGTKRLFINKTSPKKYIKRIVHHSGENITLPLTGRAYSLTVSGAGSFVVRNGNYGVIHNFNSDKKLFRGFITSDGKIEFSGDHLYYIYDFSLFDESFGDKTEDIPVGSDIRCIDLSEEEDLLALLALPMTADGKILPGSSYENGKLFLPSDFDGEIWIKYLKKPKAFSADEDDTIDVPKSYEALILPLLLSLMLAGEDSDLSEKYREIYSNMSENLKDIPKNYFTEYVISDGWA